MSTVEVAPAAPVEPVRRRRPRWIWLGLLVSLATLGWWDTHAGALTPVGNAISTPAPVGQAVLIGLFPGASDDISVLSVRPRVSENTARAEIRVVACLGASGSGLIGGALGTAAQNCASVRDPRHLVLPPTGPGAPQLVVEVIPRQPGRVVIDGVHLRYRQGLRWGSQDTGTVLTVTTAS